MKRNNNAIISLVVKFDDYEYRYDTRTNKIDYKALREEIKYMTNKLIDSIKKDDNEKT